MALIISGLDSTEKQIKAVNALQRDKVEHLVKAKEAEKWINTNFGAQAKKQPFGHTKQPVGKFASDWKYYFVRFSSTQFQEFQAIVQNQTTTVVWAEAVESVMDKSQKQLN